MMRHLIFLLLMPALPGVVSAREFVVNQKDAKASDTNAGTLEKPLKTISAAATRVQAGDKVVIHAGQYRETVIISASGTTDSPITFEAAPGETAVIKGSEIIKHWTRDTGEIWRAALPLPPTKRSPNSNDSTFWRTNNVRMVIIKDGEQLDAQHLRRVSAKDQLKPGAFFCDLPRNLLFVWLPESANPNNAEMEVALRGAWLYVFGNNITIRDLQMRHSSTLGIVGWPACVLYGNNITMEACSISWSDFVGISLGGNNDKLLRCTIACHGSTGIGGKGEGHVIEKCRVIYNNIDRYSFSWHCGGAKLIPGFTRSRVSHNEFAYNIGPGLWLDGNSNDNLLEGNLCHDNEGTGIQVEISAGNRVFNNVSYANRNPLQADYLAPDHEAARRGEVNSFRLERLGGEWLAQPLYHAGEARGIYISSAPDTKVFHNTCYLNEAEGICVEGPLRNSDGVSWSTHGSVVMNNISVYNKGTQLVMARNGRDKDTYDNRSDYNMLLALGAVFARAGWDGTIVRSLKDWQQQSGQDEHSIQAEPMFAMGAMGDFRLLPDSSGAKTGRPTDEVRDDFFGSARASNSVSIGACEVTTLDYPRPATLHLETPEKP